MLLINNYDLVTCIVIESTNDDSTESETFRAQLKSRSEEFVSLVLENHLGNLIQWSKEAESMLDGGDLEGVIAEEKRDTTIIVVFNIIGTGRILF